MPQCKNTMVQNRFLGPVLMLVMVIMPNFCLAGRNVVFNYKDMEENQPITLIYQMGKRSLCGTQDWGERSPPARPLRLGKRSVNFERVNLLNGGRFKIMKPFSPFGFKLLGK